MTIQRLDQLVALGLALLGVYLVVAGFGYGFMRDTTPGAGFFPVLIGGVIAVLSLVNLVRSLAGMEILKAAMTKGDVLRFVVVAVALLTYVWLAPVLGLALATMALMIVVGLIIRPTLEPGFLARLLTVSVVFSLACVWIFGTLLRVPMLIGPFGF
jgi:putative tricarboxylic transport membrane protein